MSQGDRWMHFAVTGALIAGVVILVRAATLLVTQTKSA
jgi:hypothetical protein